MHLLTVVPLLVSLAGAARITVTIPSTPQLQSPSTLPPTTHATLQSHGAPLSAPLTRSNTFDFNNVAVGSYLLTVHCRDYIFEPLRVDVSKWEAGEEDVSGTATGQERVEAWQTFRGNEWDNKGEKRGEGKENVVVEVRPVALKEYYQPRGGFNILAFLKSPMILMALFSMALIFGMPYLMENMDPETRAEFEEMRAKSPLSNPATNPAAQLQNFDLASWMAGKSTASEPQSGSAQKRN